jgi:hypothetical protein
MKRHANRKKFISLCILAVVGVLLFGVQPATAQSCITEKAGRSLTCTANDVRIAKADNIRNLDGTTLASCISGQYFSFIADFHLVLSASARYDIGLWFATDGGGADGALSGTCSVNMITPLNNDPIPLGSSTSVNLDNDTCRDITTANGWGPPNGGVVTVRVNNVLCQDTDGNGNLNLPNCTSWSQNSGVVCNTPQDTVPGSPSKCNCDAGFNVPIHVDTPTGRATKTVSPAALPEPGGEFTYSISFTNTSQFVSVTLDRICDDQYGTIVWNAGPVCAPGSLGIITSTTCAVPQTLAVGANYSCSFKANFNSSTAPASLTDTVTFFGHDSNTTPKPIQKSASETASITDVPPDGTVTKSLDGLLCAVVRYKVKVTNNKPSADTLTLSALSDDQFGSITSVHDDVVGTSCSVPRSVGATPYECTFDAYFCGGSHTNKVTATLNDNDSNTAQPAESNSLTINVGATLQVAP